MTKDKMKGFVSLGAILSIFGLIMIFSSVDFGTSFADHWLSKEGGADTEIYLMRISGYTNNFLATGSILLGIGLVTIMYFYYKIINYNEKNNE